jgi:cytochrome P450
LVLGEEGAEKEEAANEAEQRMSDKQVRDELLTLFLAGHETTALAVTYTFYLLAHNPAAEAKLLAELNALLGDPHSAAVILPGWEDLPKLEYTRRVFAEAMRLYPPAYATARIARHDDEIAGCRIPAGSTLIVSPYVTQRDARFWPDPQRFDPDRFSPEAEAQRPKFAYFPFGGGPRRCIGEPFAWMEGQLLVATLAHRYHIAVQEGYTPELQPLITLRPKGGLPVTVHRR